MPKGIYDRKPRPLQTSPAWQEQFARYRHDVSLRGGSAGTSAKRFQDWASQRRKQWEADASARAWCDMEIADVEAKLRAGHPDVEGLCLALADLSAERRMI